VNEDAPHAAILHASTIAQMSRITTMVMTSSLRISRLYLSGERARQGESGAAADLTTVRVVANGPSPDIARHDCHDDVRRDAGPGWG
jgi:hypothetical protein